MRIQAFYILAACQHLTDQANLELPKKAALMVCVLETELRFSSWQDKQALYHLRILSTHLKYFKINFTIYILKSLQYEVMRHIQGKWYESKANQYVRYLTGPCWVLVLGGKS